MLLIRSLIFNAVFFATITAALFLGMPLVFFDKKYIFAFWKRLSLILNFITEKIGGISFTVDNEQNLLQEPAIYAMRHESTWETLILIHKFKDPIFILKKELLRIPLFGTLSRKAETIAIDRNHGIKALMYAARRVEKFIKNGRQIVIFPEGTRSLPGQYVPLKRGVAMFYEKSNCPVVPVIHNAGTFWPRRGFIKKPGIINVNFLTPIAAGLSRDEFMDKLNDAFRREIERVKHLEG
ncbi:MAG: 1-acyl-sn-glycerol-3-phosphate acyltransferase [Holosporaceae bacterium]|jgi:1-acyl-sn-glycerol-3-phosphate acyltransferase|nr:1-acyl-sn-glycerol-3-phosphate acyltransferase [Holosporaceae bacterium]